MSKQKDSKFIKVNYIVFEGGGIFRTGIPTIKIAYINPESINSIVEGFPIDDVVSHVLNMNGNGMFLLPKQEAERIYKLLK